MEAFRSYLNTSVLKQLNALTTDVATVPGEMTVILPPLDVNNCLNL